MADARCAWQCPEDWSQWSPWLAAGLHGRPHSTLCDRSQSPWDNPDRRPSHADRRKALQRHMLRHELSTLTARHPLPRQILDLAQRLMNLAC